MLRIMSLPISIMRSLIGGSMNFSLEEQKVGTWIDGKPVYQITVEGTTAPLNSQVSIHKGTLEHLDIEKVVSIDGMLNYSYYINYSNSASQCLYVFYDHKTCTIQNYNYSVESMSNLSCCVTIWYTKKSD